MDHLARQPLVGPPVDDPGEPLPGADHPQTGAPGHILRRSPLSEAGEHRPDVSGSEGMGHIQRRFDVEHLHRRIERQELVDQQLDPAPYRPSPLQRADNHGVPTRKPVHRSLPVRAHNNFTFRPQSNDLITMSAR